MSVVTGGPPVGETVVVVGAPLVGETTVGVVVVGDRSTLLV
jgi:hypothetical protein